MLNPSYLDIERIEDRREMNPTMDAIYILSPQPHIVDCLLADFERRRYKRAYLVWTAMLDPQLRRRLDSSQLAQQQLAGNNPSKCAEGVDVVVLKKDLST